MQLRLSIGDFSRMTLLSVKALRHYHEIGLLEPVSVDPASGYRFYDAEQIPVAQVIRRLKDLGMGLDDVKRVLQAPDLASRNRAIVEHLQRLEAQLETTKATVASLRRLLEAPQTPSPKVTFRSHPQTTSLAIQERVIASEFGDWWTNAFEDLHSAVAGARLSRTGPDGALYPSEWFQDEAGEVVAFVPVAHAAGRSRIGRAQPYSVPAAEVAVLLHKGPVGDIDQTFAALGSFVLERAIGLEGPIREYYLVTSFDTPEESKHRTEVAWPIFRTAVL